MKKCKLILSFLLLLSSIVGLSACKKEEAAPTPALDLEAAVQRLTERGYDVDYAKHLQEAELPDAESFLYAEKENERIWMYLCKSERAAELRFELESLELQYRIDTAKDNLQYLEDLLDELCDTLTEEEIAKYEDSIATYERELATEENSFVGYDGCVVWRGTKTALEDTK